MLKYLRSYKDCTACQPIFTPWGFSRTSVLSMHGLGLPASSGDIPHLGIKTSSLMSPALTGRFFTTGATSEATYIYTPYLSSFLKIIEKLKKKKAYLGQKISCYPTQIKA